MKTADQLVGRTEQSEFNPDGDRAYLPSSKVRQDEFYCDEQEYREEIQELYKTYAEPDPDELSEFWNNRG